MQNINFQNLKSPLQPSTVSSYCKTCYKFWSRLFESPLPLPSPFIWKLAVTLWARKKVLVSYSDFSRSLCIIGRSWKIHTHAYILKGCCWIFSTWNMSKRVKWTESNFSDFWKQKSIYMVFQIISIFWQSKATLSYSLRFRQSIFLLFNRMKWCIQTGKSIYFLVFCFIKVSIKLCGLDKQNGHVNILKSVPWERIFWLAWCLR